MGEGCCEKYEMSDDACCHGSKSGCAESSCCEGGYCSESGMLRALSDKAWSCLMKEKIKKAYEEKMGKQMDAAAEICAEHAMKMYEMKKSGHEGAKAEIESFRKKLSEAFSKK